MFQQSLGQVSRMSLKRKGPDGNGLKNVQIILNGIYFIDESKGVNCI